MSENWNEYFFQLAKVIANKSKDPSRKIGCVIVGEDNEIRSTGYNGFVRGVLEKSERYSTREEKLKWTEHAERNAIYNAARVGIPLKNCKIYIWGLPPCIECSKAIIQSGIKEIHYRIEGDLDEKRKDDLEKYSMEMFRENGIKIFKK